MTQIAIVYHSGYGHTKAIAEAVNKGVASVEGVTALWPTALSDHVSATGPLSDRIPEIADHLRGRLRPAA